MTITGTRILVVDHDRTMRMLLRVVLEGAGAMVLDAPTPEQALRLLSLHPDIAAVVTDSAGQNQGEADLVRQLHARGSGLPIVLCSGGELAAHPFVVSGMVQAHVSKPFAPSVLVRRLERALERRAALPKSDVA